MLKKLRDLLGSIAPAGDSQPEQELDLAVAVLLVEMARADHHLAEVEKETISRQLQASFELDPESAAALLERARAKVRDSVSMHEFTRALHEGMDYQEKLRVIEMLWRVALSDHNLDKYEDYLISKLGELLYVSRGDVIRLRHRVSDALPKKSAS